MFFISFGNILTCKQTVRLKMFLQNNTLDSD